MLLAEIALSLVKANFSSFDFWFPLYCRGYTVPHSISLGVSTQKLYVNHDSFNLKSIQTKYRKQYGTSHDKVGSTRSSGHVF